MDGAYEAHRDNMTSLAIWPTLHNSCNPHFHNSIELTYVLDGELKTIVGGKTYVAHKNNLLIYSSYCTHANMQEGRAKSIVMIIPPDLIGEAGGQIAGKVFRETVVDSPQLCEEVLYCMRQLIRQKARVGLESCAARGYAYVIVGLLIESVGLTDRSHSKADYFFKDILSYIEEHFTAPLSLEKISAAFGYSKYSFSHLFNSYFGCTLTDYVNSLRARCAAHLLTTGNDSMTEIAMRSGFESLRTFYRVFKKCYGCTPSNYKRRKSS